ncbi:hypothetical protein BW45_17845 [Agrobacterium tumefaciens]|nr:hypothetical protein BW45_17845 [Agrobacterium tumefaciens]
MSNGTTASACADRALIAPARSIAIARVLLFEPFCLVADEPTSRIDPLVQREVIRLLCELVDERGMSLVLTSHDRRLVRAIADEVIELG